MMNDACWKPQYDIWIPSNRIWLTALEFLFVLSIYGKYKHGDVNNHYGWRTFRLIYIVLTEQQISD